MKETEKQEQMEWLQNNIKELKKEMSRPSYKIKDLFRKIKYHITYNKKDKIKHIPFHKCKDIDYIDICFENCEWARVHREEIGNFYMSNIQKTISICSNAVIESYIADTIYLTIRKECADKIETSFGQYFPDKADLTNRVINSNDITSFRICYNTNEKEEVTVPWSGDDDYINPGQTCRIELDKTSRTKQEYVVIEIKRKDVKNV